jgi:hypothetical protein
MSDPAKRLRVVARKCFERMGIIERKLYVGNPKVVEEKRYLIQDTVERGLYMAGYLQALKDTRSLVSEGSFPDNEIEGVGRALNPLSNSTEVGPVSMCLSCSVKAASATSSNTVPLCPDCLSLLDNPRGVTYSQPDSDMA